MYCTRRNVNLCEPRAGGQRRAPGHNLGEQRQLELYCTRRNVNLSCIEYNTTRVARSSQLHYKTEEGLARTARVCVPRSAAMRGAWRGETWGCFQQFTLTLFKTQTVSLVGLGIPSIVRVWRRLLLRVHGAVQREGDGLRAFSDLFSRTFGISHEEVVCYPRA